jgi:hypothetical protein
LPGRENAACHQSIFDSLLMRRPHDIVVDLCLSFVCALIPKVKKYEQNCEDSGLRGCKIENSMGNDLKFKFASMK